MKKENCNVVVGLSGGVDSAVAAYLLVSKGYHVRAVFMKNVSERTLAGFHCPWREDKKSAYRVAAALGIPIETWNFEHEYGKKVIRYLFTEYRRGRTPNPDVMCNQEIKFKLFLDRALGMGACAIATGHYARLRRDRDGTVHLLAGKDRAKDQSYFLARLTQRQLAHALFPLGGYTKQEVRAIARRRGLPNAERPDSQGICFIGEVTMSELLKTRIKPRRGEIVDTEGTVIGEHDGVWFYTIGQRHGLKLGGGPIRYVVSKDMRRNRLMVGSGHEAALFQSTCELSGWRWIARRYSFPFACSVQIRYHQSRQSATIQKKSNRIFATFKRPQRAIAPGQVLAAYCGAQLVGSGIIAR